MNLQFLLDIIQLEWIMNYRYELFRILEININIHSM